MQTSWKPCSSSLSDMITNQAARNTKNQTTKGSFAPANHINSSWVRSWLPRVKFPELRWTFPRAEWWVSGIGRPSVRMSLRAMVLLQALVGVGDDPVAELGILLADDDVERELHELADSREPTMA